MFCFVLLRFVFKGKCRWSLGGADAFDASWRVGRESSSCNKLLLHLHLCFESKLRRGIDATSWTRIRTILSTDWGRKISTCYVIILVLLIKIWIRALSFAKGLTQSPENTRKVRKIIYVLSIKWMHLYLIGKGGIFSAVTIVVAGWSESRQPPNAFEKIFLLKCALQ